MHSNDLEACGMKLCCFLFHSDVKFLTRSLYSGERQWPAWASCSDRILSMKAFVNATSLYFQWTRGRLLQKHVIAFRIFHPAIKITARQQYQESVYKRLPIRLHFNHIGFFIFMPPPFEAGGAYCFAYISRSVHRPVDGLPNLVQIGNQ